MSWRRGMRDAASLGQFAIANRLWSRASRRGANRLGRAFLSGRRDLYMAIAAHAEAAPDELAVSDAEQSWTYAELLHASEQVARALCRMRVATGQRVAVVLNNRCAHVASVSGIRMAGCIPVPLSPRLPAAQLIRVLRSSPIASAIVEGGHAAAACEGLRHPAYRVISMQPSDEAPHISTWQQLWAHPARGTCERRPSKQAPDIVLHTSGTTSGQSTSTSVHMSRAGVATAFRYASALTIGADSTLFTPCPLYHAAPMLLSGLVWTLGGHVVLRDRLDEEAWQTFSWSDATHAFLVPTLLEALSRADEGTLNRLRAGPLRGLISSGAPLRPTLKTRLLDRLGPVLYDMYGATELGLVSIAGPRDLALYPETVGRPLPGVECRLVRPDGTSVPPGEPGELFVRSASVTPSDTPPRTPDLAGFETAGYVARRKDGWLFIVDRVRDVVISGGVNVFPADVEQVLESHPAIRSAACFGQPHPKWGEAVCAAVVLEEGLALPSNEDWTEHCKKQLPPAAVPKTLHCVAALPVSATGKVLRRELATRFNLEAPRSSR